VVNLIKDNPRALFDVFDENNIIISTVYSPVERVFKTTINGDELIDEKYSSRKEAEYNTIQTAFELLNDKLSLTNA
jgi:hypothetical protein